MKHIRKASLILSVLLLFPLVSSASVSAGPDRTLVFAYFTNTPTPDDHAFINGLGGSVRFTYRDMPVLSIDLPTNAVDNLLQRPNVRKVESVGAAFIAIESAEVTGGRQPGQSTPWGITKIRADQTWNVTTGSGVKVAVLDTGVDIKPNHPDLKFNIAWTETLLGIYRDADDLHGHGTHVSGTILALMNDIGVVGVSHEASLYALQVCDELGRCFFDAITAGVEEARYGPDGVLGSGDDSDVINMSFTSTVPIGEAFETQIANAYSEGIVMVAAAGNTGSSPVGYPAAYLEVIAVGATDEDDLRWSSSSYGVDLELVAPGVMIYSTWKDSSYATGNGTSFASPHVVGTVALMLAKNSTLTLDTVRSILRDTAVDLGDPGFDQYYGYGRVDALAAVQATP